LANLTVRINTYQVTIEKPSTNTILDANSEFLRYLRFIGGRDAQQTYIRYVNQWVAQVPSSGTQALVDLVSLGQSEFWPYTTKSPLWTTPPSPVTNPNLKWLQSLVDVDPVNLIFWGNASSGVVESCLMNNVFPKWFKTRYFWQGNPLNCADSHCLYINNTSFGGRQGWIWMDSSLSNCVCAGQAKRCHIRLFDGRDGEPTYGNFTIAAVHYEEVFWLPSFPPLRHTILDWDLSQKFIETLFRGLHNVVSVTRTRLQQQEMLQNVVNDGEATFIEIT